MRKTIKNWVSLHKKASRSYNRIGPNKLCVAFLEPNFHQLKILILVLFVLDGFFIALNGKEE